MSIGKAIAALSGQEQVLVVRRPFVEWLGGDVVAALMLDQALHWSSTDTAKGRGGWFYQSDEAWSELFFVSTYQVRKARQALLDDGLIAAERRGTPARMWYACDAELVAERFVEWLEGKSRADDEPGEDDVAIKSRDIEGLESRDRETSPSDPEDIHIQKNTLKTSSVDPRGEAGASPPGGYAEVEAGIAEITGMMLRTRRGEGAKYRWAWDLVRTAHDKAEGDVDLALEVFRRWWTSRDGVKDRRYKRQSEWAALLSGYWVAGAADVRAGGSPAHYLDLLEK